MQEPKNGDFVAYIEALQRESEARLARPPAMIVGAPVAGNADAQVQVPEPARRVAGGQFTRRERDAKLVRAVVPAAVGAALLLSWLGNGGAFAFILGAGLLAYVIPRLIAALRRADAPPTSRTVIDREFGRSRTTGTRE